jgi:hypothetical protein
MLIETTLHVHKSILDKLYQGAVTTGRSTTSIIKLLIQRFMNDNRRMTKTNSRIQYQERDLKENWHCIHVVFNEYEYEYCLDLRKFCKLSVSYILAYAVRRYLDEVLEELLNGGTNTDNYYYCNYVFIRKIVNNVICWQIYWGLPLQLNDLLK